jgi:hypothetical protein
MLDSSKERGLQALDYLATASVAALLFFVGSGCASLGPKTVLWERTEYNLAIQETEDAQLLLNLVRLKYRDTPIFLELSSISSQSSLETGLGTGDSLAEVTGSTVTWKVGPTLLFSTQPTITYTPFQGERFANQILAPIKIETLMLLYRSGWPLRRVLLLGAQRLNRVENAVRASGPTPGKAPGYESFARVVDLMVELNQEGLLDIVYETTPTATDQVRIALRVDPRAFPLPKTQELLKLLDLVPDKQHYAITYQIVEHGAAPELDHLEVGTRSLLGMLFFLSQAVEVPHADVKGGLATTTMTEDGSVFDWKKVTGEMLQVKSSPSHPEKAAVSVEYRRSWFYIDDADLRSKSTFSLLMQLVALQSGETRGLTPIVTLPVGEP